ncbi:SDR family oxidoreductase [Agromyces sp. MMS24-JH15]|uniref:SDR family oxidoreductase n=1 Tax=Agromyces sp. MMS24-JH15 TaxID=3243765 RepID=UPI00374876B6
MKIIIIGGTGLIGSRVVELLAAHGHEAVAASPNSGVNTITGEGLAETLTDASVVIDVSNSPSFEDQAVLDFFTTSTRNQLAAEHRAGVRHHVALSIVGADRVPSSGYLRAKVAQERLIEESGQPYSIVRATQFYEFILAIADSMTDDGTTRAPTALMQPMPAAEVSLAVARVAEGEPINGVLEIGGPERIGMDQMIRKALAAAGDTRTVVSEQEATYFGAVLSSGELTTGPDAQLSATTFEDWRADRAAAVK